MIVRQPLWLAVGWIHAISVIPDDSPSDGDDGTLTRPVEPLNDNAPPYLPVTHDVPPEIVPLFPLPDTSANVDPAPASNVYPATRPAGPGGASTALADAPAQHALPSRAGSRALTRQ